MAHRQSAGRGSGFEGSGLVQMRCAAGELAAIDAAAETLFGGGWGAKSQLLRAALEEYLTARGLPTTMSPQDERQLVLNGVEAS